MITLDYDKTNNRRLQVYLLYSLFVLFILASPAGVPWLRAQTKWKWIENDTKESFVFFHPIQGAN